MLLAYNKEHASFRVGVQFRNALHLKQCQNFEFAYQNLCRCGIINFIEFWKRRNLTQILVVSYIAHEMASHYGLPDFIRFQEKPPQKRVPSNPIVFLHQYIVEWSKKRGSWMDNSLDITSTDATGVPKEHANTRVGVQFRKALQLKQCQYFVFAYQNSYRCGIINFIEFWKRRNLTQILVVSYSSRNSFSLWTSRFHSISRETNTETSSIQSYCVSTSI